MQENNSDKKVNLPEKLLPKKPLTKKEVHEVARERISLISTEFSEGFKFLEKYPKSVTFFGSARVTENNLYYEQSRSIAGKIVRELGYSVLSGGGPGAMEAANRGALENNGESIGLTIELPEGQASNPYVNDSIDFYYFFSRKVCLSFSAEAYIFLPGGYGTFDELFEILTLVQTHKIEHVPVILLGVAFWKNLDEFIKTQLLGNNMIDTDDVKLYTITDDEDEIIRLIRQTPIKNTEEFPGEPILKKHHIKIGSDDEEKSADQSGLASKKCVPCEGGTPKMPHSESEHLLKKVNQWILNDDVSIEKTLHMKNFTEVISLVNRIAHIAEQENHHPDMTVFNFNKLKITLSTHAIGGLSENDFIMAAKIDELLR